MQIVRSKKENCKTCLDELRDGMEEPCLSCMMDKENPAVNYYTNYRRDYNKWPESELNVSIPVPRVKGDENESD